MVKSSNAVLTERQQYWQDHLDRCDASDQTMKAYAAAHGLMLSTLYFYRRRLRKVTVVKPGRPRFVQASVPAVATRPVGCRIHLRNGVTVEIGIGAGELGTVLASVASLT